MRRVQGVVAVVLVALGAFASTASAESLSMTFSEARANVGVQLFDEDLFGPPETAALEAQIDPASGEITAGSLQVPDFETHIDSPINADVTVRFEIGEISGHFNAASGALSLSGTAGGTLTAEGKECEVSTELSPLTLTTAGNSGGTTNPRSGVPFSSGLAGGGAIAGQWIDMRADPIAGENISFCENVEDEIEGLGGIWLDQADLVAPIAPQLLRTDPDSPNSHGTPRIIGRAEPGSTVRLFAGAGCTGAPVATANAAQLEWPGIAVAVAEGANASFSATATDAAGNTSPCSAPISYLRPQVEPPAPVCVVPKVVGKKLAKAKAALRAANCAVGKVTKPKRPKGKKHWVLVVKSTNPAAGAKPANGKVNLRLGPK